jgi:hypothetical protein
MTSSANYVYLLIGMFTTLIIIALPLLLLFRRTRLHKRPDFVKMIHDARKLELSEDYIDYLVGKHKQQTLFELTGLDMDLASQEIIIQNSTLKKYTRKDIKRMAEYYKFDSGELHVELGGSNKVAFIICSVFAVFMSVFSLACLYTAFEFEVPSGNFWAVLLFGVAYFTGAILFYRATILPYRYAKVLKQQLKNDSADFKSTASNSAMEITNN